MSACEQPKPVTWQCDGPDCTSCAQVARCAARVLDLADTLVGIVKTLLAERDEVARAARIHEEAAARLEAERQKYTELNRRLNVRANGIRAVTAYEKKESSGRRSRSPGKGTAVNRQFEESEVDARETADLGACPGCGGEQSGVTGEYTRRYERVTIVTEKVLCTVRLRYCCKCKKQYTAKPKGVAPNAHVSANHLALLAWLNVKGLSHGGTAELSSDFLKAPVSRSGSHRKKVRAARTLRPDYEAVREGLMKEEVLHCDELWWPLGEKKGVVVTVQGGTSCLMSVEMSRSSETLKGIVGDFQGITVQDSYTGWLHIGVNHQMYIPPDAPDKVGPQVQETRRGDRCVPQGAALHTQRDLRGEQEGGRRCPARRGRPPGRGACRPDVAQVGGRGRRHRKVQEAVQEGVEVSDRLPAGAGRPARQQPGREVKQEGGGGPERRWGNRSGKGMRQTRSCSRTWSRTGLRAGAFLTTWCRWPPATDR